MKVLTAVSIAFLLGVNILQAKTYYVDPVSGSDTGAGTLAEPWQSITKPLHLPIPEGRAKAAAD